MSPAIRGGTVGGATQAVELDNGGGTIVFNTCYKLSPAIRAQRGTDIAGGDASVPQWSDPTRPRADPRTTCSPPTSGLAADCLLYILYRDGCTALWLPSQGDRGRAPSVASRLGDQAQSPA
jgi:hypothetical protein